jgi:acyl transferase domain-containing protein/NAD(P)-dependent dehydrogenase (short-subunit alcohol dehydrogenase family)
LNPSDPSPQVPVAIIGMGCLFPQAEGLARYWANIRRGVDAISEVPESHWRVADYFDSNPKAPDRTYAHRGGFLMPVDFPPMEFGIAPNAIEATDTTQLLGLMVARRALDDAGYGGDRPLDRDRVSVILGVTGTLELVIPLGARLGHPIWRRALQAAGVDETTTEDVVRRISESYVGWQENSFPGLLGNVAAGRIANRLDLHGTNCVVDAACASSLGAVNLSMLELATGRCDLAVTGGLDTFNDIFMYMCFSKTPALSPSGDARPFDAEADGTILGEGLGVVVLKRLADARRDGDRVYAVIRSVGTSSDGKGQAVYAPSAVGQAKALRRAYAMAGISPATVELVEAHGTGTRVGDAIELSALEEVYRDARPAGTWCALGSVKSQVGHTKAAAGAAGLIKAALALHHKVLPPTLKVRRPMGSLAGGDSPFYLNTEARPWLSGVGGPRRAALSAFGFGGSNFHCVLEEAELEKPGVDWDGDVQILAFSADDPAEIAASLVPLEGLAAWPEIRTAAARSRAQFRSSHRHRLLLVAVRGEGAWGELLAEARSQLEAEPSRKSVPPMPRRVFSGTGPRPGALAMLFPGQGSQYVGMQRELACLFPGMQASLARMNQAVADGAGAVSDRIYPPAAFDDASRQASEDALRATGVAQPAIGAVSLGLLRILETFGIRPDLVGGHSFGELTALCAAGRIDDADLARLADRRGALMAGCAAKGSGAMLAVFAPIEEVSAMVRENRLDLVVANKNAPRQCVLSGSAAEIERGRRMLADRRITTRDVPVAAAFHSRFVAEAEGPFRATVEAVPFRASTIPVFANTTAEPYPDDPDSVRDLLAGQLARPVEFVAQVEAMYRRGARTFLEAGPDAKLTGLVRAILEGRDHRAIAVDASRGSAGNVHDLACALATLAALGYAVDLNHWDEGESARAAPATKPGLTVRISGANARPKDRPAEGPAEKSAPIPPPPVAEPLRPRAEAPRTPRFSLSEAMDPTMPDTQTRQHAENHRTMNQPERIPSHHSNGHTSTHALHRPQAVEEQEPPTRVSPLSPEIAAPTDLAFAFHAAQENLVALQRLAEQTADLHRQFLEGQEKTQQTFLKLLERQQHLSHAMLDPADAPPAPTPETGSHAVPTARAHAAGTAAPQEGTAEPRAFAEPRPAVMPAPRPASPEPVAEEVISSIVEARSDDKPGVPEPVRMPAARIDHPMTMALVDVVAEKTGYPAEVLDLDMQLDADLGIDSIKRVEILSALQERHPELPPLPPEQLGSFRTLRAIAEFIGRDLAEGRGQETRAERSEEPRALAGDDRPGAGLTVSPALAQVLLETVAEKTGYPAEMLDLDMRLDADLGIDSIKRVEILSALQDRFPGLPPAGPERLGTLATLRDIVGFLGEDHSPPPTPHPPLPKVHTEHRLLVGSDLSPLPTPNSPPRMVRTEPRLSGAMVARALLEAVAEKTGYPVEMLDLDMRLDADLGIDSIKRVEIFSAVQERLPETTSIGPDQTGTLQTLRQIVEFLATPPCPEPDPEPTPTHPRHDENGRAGAVPGRNGKAAHAEGHERIAQPSRGGHGHANGQVVGLRCLEPRAVSMPASERRSALSLPAGGTIWITDDGSALTDAVSSLLIDRGYRVRVIPAGRLDPPDADEALCGLIVLAPRGRIDSTFIDGSFRTIRVAGPALLRSGQRGGASLLTVARLDGSFGLGGLARELDPASGALAGLAKTAGQEWPGVHCKAVDLDTAFGSSVQAAAGIVDEFLTGGPAEVGLGARGRSAIELVPARASGAASGRAPRLGRGDLVVITGGARGITAEVAVALAEAFQPRLLLLGRSPEPESAEDGLFADCRDEAELKRAILTRSDRTRPPQAIGEHVRQIMAGREVRRNLDRIAAAGSPVVYRSVDVRDQAAVRQAIAWARGEFGPVRGLIHGAGVLADRKIADQTDAQFDLVYGTKVEGLHHLLDAIDTEALEVLVLFSSSTARFGRSGQVAYAAANEYLNKWAQQGSVRMPHCRVVSFNWGPWAGGMVTDALRPLFEKEGLSLIPTDAGARLVVDEIQHPRGGPGPVEIVVLAEQPSASSSFPEPSSAPVKTPVAQKWTLAYRRVVDVSAMPILADHVIDGKAVLPMAMILEWVAEGALQRNPGLVVCGIDDLRLFKGVVLSGREPVTIDVMAGKGVRKGTEFVVPIELRGMLANGREVIHARADVTLGDQLEAGTRRLMDRPMARYPRSRDAIYRDILFHGPGLQGIEQIEACNERAIAARIATSPPPSEWVDRPSRSRWLTDPLSIDCVFQLLVVWCRENLGANSLPTAVGHYQQFRPGFGDGPLRVLAEVRQASEMRAIADIEILDARGELVARLDSSECVVDLKLNQAFRLNRLVAPSSVVAG